MKKRTVLIALLSIVLLGIPFVTTNANPQIVEFSVGVCNPGGGIFNPYPGGNPLPKTSPACPIVLQDRNSIFFEDTHEAFTVELIYGCLTVYTTVVAADQTTLTFPTWLSGDFELRLYDGHSPYYFYGYITL